MIQNEESLESKVAKLRKAGELNLKLRELKKLDKQNTPFKFTKPTDPVDFYSNAGTYLYNDRNTNKAKTTCHMCGRRSDHLNRCEICGNWFCGECLPQENHNCLE